MGRGFLTILSPLVLSLLLQMLGPGAELEPRPPPPCAPLCVSGRLRVETGAGPLRLGALEGGDQLREAAAKYERVAERSPRALGPRLEAPAGLESLGLLVPADPLSYTGLAYQLPLVYTWSLVAAAGDAIPSVFRNYLG